MRPFLADLRNDARNFLLGAGRSVDICRTQFRRQQVIAAEDVERQIAIAVVIAVKEPAFLVAVDRIVGSVQVEDDLRRRRRVSLQEDIDE